VSANVPTVPFVKASACGNSFLLIEGKFAPSDIAAFSRQICDRNDGVGADGVEWMFPHASADVEIRLVNADGSEAEISGNGTRCVAAYLSAGKNRAGKAGAEPGKEKITIQTGAGLKTCTLLGQRGPEYEFEIEMGEAVVEKELSLHVGCDAQQQPVRGIPVSMGNPHYVIFVSEFDRNWQAEAAKIQRNEYFKHGVNVELVSVEGEHDIAVRFFERGVGETQSSGTGSCASAVAAIAIGRAQSPVQVHALGGTQTVRQEGSVVFLRGAARLVCRGEFFLDELLR
jgi:diaminopimelate epimerase